MEANLWKALHDPATLSELAILAVYGEAVSYPYVKAIRTTSESGEKQNMLDLGVMAYIYITFQNATARLRATTARDQTARVRSKQLIILGI